MTIFFLLIDSIYWELKILMRSNNRQTQAWCNQITFRFYFNQSKIYWKLLNKLQTILQCFNG